VHIAAVVLNSEHCRFGVCVLREEYRAVVGAVDGANSARVAGRRLPRLLRGALLTLGLSALTWLLSMLIGTVTASADPAPPSHSPPSSSTGLLGGLVGALGGVLNTATTTVGQVTGGLLDTASSVVPPVVSPPQAVPESPPQPEPVKIDTPAVARSAVHAIVPVARPTEALIAPDPAPPAPPIVTEPAAPAQVEVAVAVGHRTEPIAAEPANPPGPDRAPAKTPTAPPTPAVPTSNATSGHDGPGQARGIPGVLAGAAGSQPPAAEFSTRGRTRKAGDPAAGLPAASPD